MDKNKHYFIFFLALIVGLVMLFPQAFFQYKLGEDFKGVHQNFNNDEIYYLARAKDIIDGYPTLGNPYIFELKDSPSMQVFLPDFLLAKPLQAFNIDVTQGFIFYDFLLPFIVIILTYYAVWILSQSHFWSFNATALLMGMFLYRFNRPFSPQFVFLFWLSQFIFLLMFIKTKRKLNKFFWLSGLNFGLLFYIYPYFWSFYLGLLIILIFAFFIIGQKKQALNFFYITLIGLFLAIPYFISNWKTSQLPEYMESLTRLGLIDTRFPTITKILIFAVFVIILFLIAILKKKTSLGSIEIFLLSGLLATILVSNSHLITGKNLFFASHYFELAHFWTVFSFVYIFNLLFTNQSKTWRFLIGVLIWISILFNFYQYLSVATKIEPRYIYWQNYGSVFEWLNKNTAKDSVVYTNEELSHLIPVYTSNNIFYCRGANLHFISDQEVLDRFILNNFFEGFDEKFVFERYESIFGVRYQNKYRTIDRENMFRKLLFLPLRENELLPKEEIEKVLVRYEELHSSDFEKEFKKYRVDYFIWDKNKNPEWKINDLQFLKKVYETNNILVYQIEP